MRLIDADTAFGVLADYYHHTMPIQYMALKEALDRVPTVEAVPERKKGRWIDCVGSDHWKCSECGDRAPMYWDANRQEYDEWYAAYCPNCGAKMEGAEDDA